jgi:twinkle protein
MDNTKAGASFLRGSFLDIKDRNLKSDICRQYGYMVDEEGRHIANYRDASGAVVAQKVRSPGKQFKVIGDGKAMPLYGQHLFSGGKSVVITEGEIDALSVAQAFNGKWAAVSLPHGAQSAVKAIQASYEWLDQFDKIVICFDQDEPGRKASAEVAEALPVGKAFTMTLARKDASDVLTKDGAAAITQAFWNAKAWRPDGIIAGLDLTKEALQKASVRGYSIPFPGLDSKMEGFREGELTLLTAGSGIGKSTFARELAYHLHQAHNLTIGNIYLEESAAKTAQGYVAIHSNVPLGKLRSDPNAISEEQWDISLREVVHQRMFFYDHFGSLDSARLLSKIRYMRTVLGVSFVILDHISIVISGQESSSEGERKDIDRLMTALRSLIEETGVGIIGIVHLNSAEGKAHEEGGRVTLKNLRGSGALKQLSDNVIALERDQQAKGDEADESSIRLLKCREFGDVGLADRLKYNRVTGRYEVKTTELAPDEKAEKYSEAPGKQADLEDDIPF